MGLGVGVAVGLEQGALSAPSLTRSGAVAAAEEARAPGLRLGLGLGLG